MPANAPRWRQPANAYLLSSLALLGGSLLSAQTSAAADAALVEKGRQLAEHHCARCHVVSDQDRFGGISSTPSFKIMIEALDDWEERFHTFMARNPHPAHIRLKDDAPRPDNLPPTVHEVILSHDDIEAILAYVDTLAKELGKN